PPAHVQHHAPRLLLAAGRDVRGLGRSRQRGRGAARRAAAFGAAAGRAGSAALMARAAVGVDLGGSHVMAAVVEDTGEIHAKFEHDLSDNAPGAVIDALADVVKSAIASTKHDIMGIGIGSPGNIDPASGTIRYS